MSIYDKISNAQETTWLTDGIAEAEAKSMAIRAKALSQNKSLVQYEAVQKWDGKMPQYMLGSSVPFINVTPESVNNSKR